MILVTILVFLGGGAASATGSEGTARFRAAMVEGPPESPLEGGVRICYAAQRV
jgi:hypothetical protein